MSGVGTKTTAVRNSLVTTVTLNAPGNANALDEAMVEELHDTVDRATDNGTRLLVIRAAGDVFSAGLALDGLEEETDASLLLRLIRIELLLEKLWYGPLISVALVRGAAVGAGADLVMATGVRYATAKASLRFPGSEFGAVLGVRRLAECTNTAFAAEVAATGRVIDAREAAHAGIWRLLDHGKTPDVERLARHLLRRSPETIRALHREAGSFRPGPDPLGTLVRSLAMHPGLGGRIREMNERRRQARRSTV